MHSFQEYVAQGQAWLFLPLAVLLGALHGLEPGHSKTMMAAFIISVRGTVMQAVLLGLSAAFSHTLVIWLLAGIGLHYSGKLDVETLEPWFQAGTGVIVILMAGWMFRRIRREQREAHAHAHHHHDDHEHGPHGGVMVDIEGGRVELSVFETGVPPRFRLYFYGQDMKAMAPPNHAELQLETVRPGGVSERFEFKLAGDYLEALTELPEPHEFEVSVLIRAGGASQKYTAQFVEGHDHHHGPGEPVERNAEYEDAHQRAHAEDFKKRFAGRTVTTGQIVMFGLTGGLMPCPAAFAILLVCLQIKQFTLGFALVLAFSVGLAVTLVTVGALAAYSVREVSRRFTKFGDLAGKLPYASVALMTVIGVVVAAQGLSHLLHGQ